MGIQLFVSNQLSRLSDKLSEQLSSNISGVFEKKIIITQTEGINTWLKSNIAGSLGIAANCSFNKSNDIVFLLHSMLLKSSQSVISADYLKWAIYRQLEDAQFIAKYPSISTYYVDNDVKKIALAERVADLFDQYQMYRPEMIESWNKQSIAEAEEWQQYIWICIRKKVGETFQDKTTLINAIVTALKDINNSKLIKKKIPVLYFFGIAVITPFYLKLFNLLSQHIDIQFYLLNPAPTSFWLEDLSEKQIARITSRNKENRHEHNFFNEGNSLLLNWGKIIKESFALLFEEEQYVNQYDDCLSEEPKEPTTLLEKIQHDIFFNAVDSRNSISEEDLHDGSITINACFTPVREVEVLYNYLVELIDKRKEQFSARDMVVMVSDIDTYTPFIRAVFDNAPYEIPYSIADESLSSGNNFFSAVQLLLELDPNSFKAEEIMELLESVYIKKRFGFENIGFLREAVKNAGIRFGVKGDNEDDSRLVSWDYGLQRLMLGICISGEPFYDTGNETIIPLDICEGTETAQLIRFWHFIQVLKTFIEARNQQRTVTEWSEYLCELVENLVFQTEDNEDEDYHQFVSYTEQLTLLTDVEDLNISFEVFLHSFLHILNSNKRSQAFSGRGVTFCSLIPMRSIPFKVVAMLGMDFDKFPRRDAAVSFNLLEIERRKGDRKVKDNDKHLFLENILSAKRYLYISFIGRSTKDATAIPASSVVDELVNYITQGVEIGGGVLKKSFITVHPLQGFSRQYFNGSGLINYLKDPQAFVLKRTHNTIDPIQFIKEVGLDQLISFYKDPVKWYFNKSLRVYYRDHEVLLPETEVFNLDSLSLWGIKNDLIQQTNAEQAVYLERSKLKGMLPLKNMGTMVTNNLKESIDSIRKCIEAISDSKPRNPQSIHLSIDNVFVTGQIKSVYGDQMVSTCESTNRNKYVIGAFIEYTAARAQDLPIDFSFLHFDPNAGLKPFQLVQAAYSQAKALEILTAYVQNFITATNTIFSFYPRFTQNPFKLFKGDYSEFVKQIETMQQKSGYLFDDQYLSRAIANGFLAEDNYAMLQKQSLSFFNPIEALIPGIIA